MSEKTERIAAAFEDYAVRIPMRQLLCRVQGHRFPDMDDHARTRYRIWDGVIHVEVECLRRCGTAVTSFLDPDGYVVKSRRVLHYDPDRRYLLPKEASGPGLTKERRARLRKEVLLRQAEYITEEQA
jgi:hypothetical protein